MGLAPLVFWVGAEAPLSSGSYAPVYILIS